VRGSRLEDGDGDRDRCREEERRREIGVEGAVELLRKELIDCGGLRDCVVSGVVFTCRSTWEYSPRFVNEVSSLVVVMGTLRMPPILEDLRKTDRTQTLSRSSWRCSIQCVPNSSWRPISSKLEISARKPSGPESWEERKEDDLEDLDPERSGGESGAMETVVISSPNASRTGVD